MTSCIGDYQSKASEAEESVIEPEERLAFF